MHKGSFAVIGRMLTPSPRARGRPAQSCPARHATTPSGRSASGVHSNRRGLRLNERDCVKGRLTRRGPKGRREGGSGPGLPFVVRVFTSGSSGATGLALGSSPAWKGDDWADVSPPPATSSLAATRSKAAQASCFCLLAPGQVLGWRLLLRTHRRFAVAVVSARV